MNYASPHRGQDAAQTERTSDVFVREALFCCQESASFPPQCLKQIPGQPALSNRSTLLKRESSALVGVIITGQKNQLGPERLALTSAFCLVDALQEHRSSYYNTMNIHYTLTL